MKNQLKKALETVKTGELTLLKESAIQVKQFPRTEQNLFDTSSVDQNEWEAAKWVYPVYAAFETECNKEEGYPDLVAQILLLNEKQKAAGSVEVTADFLETLITTIDYVTPQLYEYYRQLVDLFRVEVKNTIATYYKENFFGGEAGKQSGVDARIRETIAHAGDTFVLLAEKYVEYR